MWMSFQDKMVTFFKSYEYLATPIVPVLVFPALFQPFLVLFAIKGYLGYVIHPRL